MHQILISCREAMIAAVPLLPLFWVLNDRKFHDNKRSILYLCFAVYIAAMYAAVGLPDITYYRYSPRLNLTPFLYMFSAWDTTLLNVLLFLPLGLLLPILWKSFHSPVRTIFLGFSISLFIEFLQIFTYRATDVNDLITNTFGTILGYLLGILMLKVFPAIKPHDTQQDMYLIFGSSFAVMFFVYPFLARLLQ